VEGRVAEGRHVISRIGQILVVTLEGAADAGALSAASHALAEMQTRHGANGVVFEVSGCEVIDLDEFRELQKVVGTMQWLGLRCVIAGLRPGIVAYLASAGISAGSLRTSLDLELALLELNPSRDEPEPETQTDSELEPEYEPDDARPF
jgi:anti-anti-sigma regulatory factor